MDKVVKDKKKNPSSERKGSRIDIVKKVMREKKLSMIEASKYVKAHKLY